MLYSKTSFLLSKLTLENPIGELESSMPGTCLWSARARRCWLPAGCSLGMKMRVAAARGHSKEDMAISDQLAHRGYLTSEPRSLMMSCTYHRFASIPASPLELAATNDCASGLSLVSSTSFLTLSESTRSSFGLHSHLAQRSPRA